MRFIILVPLFLFCALVSAFPPGVLEALTRAQSEGTLNPRADSPFVKRQAPGVTPPFDPEAQYVSNQGAHAFNPPSGSDQRGPCPGLNAMANHGYLDHSGVGSIQDFIDGTTEAFGMGWYTLYHDYRITDPSKALTWPPSSRSMVRYLTET